jgi:hypothetical protein
MLKTVMTAFAIAVLFTNSFALTQQSSKDKKEQSSAPSNPDEWIVIAVPLAAVQRINLPAGENAWVVRIITRGGFYGNGKGDLAITSDGNLTWTGAGDACNSTLQNDALQNLAALALSPSASRWTTSGASLCRDCYTTMVVLSRRESGGVEKIYVAYWDDASRSAISEEVLKLYERFLAFKGCKN